MMEVQIMGLDSNRDLKNELVGRKIVVVATTLDYLWLTLDNGTILHVTFKRDVGADGGQYDFLFVKIYKEGE